jgi:hypothetical protein
MKDYQTTQKMSLKRHLALTIPVLAFVTMPVCSIHSRRSTHFVRCSLGLDAVTWVMRAGLLLRQEPWRDYVTRRYMKCTHSFPGLNSEHSCILYCMLHYL